MPNRRSNSASAWPHGKAEPATSASGRVATRPAVRRLPRLGGAARFNYGSTVIVLLPPGVAGFAPTLHAESPVKLGQCLATRER